MHALREEFDSTKLRRARAASEIIDLRTLKSDLINYESPSTTSEQVSHLNISVPAITCGTFTHPHELKKDIDIKGAKNCDSDRSLFK